MKILGISDLHGRSFSTVFYQQVSLYKDIDYIVQLGDWFDTEVRSFSSTFQLNNFKQMCKIARKNKNVYICIGNHDATYLYGKDTHYSIHCFGYEDEIKNTIEENLDVIHYGVKFGNWIFSHAGISKTLLNELKAKDIDELTARLRSKDYSIFTDSKAGLLYKRVHEVKDHNLQWHDLLNNKLEGCNQVIGHYSSMGMHIMPKLGIYDIEDFNHANCVLFEI